MSSRSNEYWVYIVTNNTRSTLYIGVTSDLRVRVWQHRAGERPDIFSQRYHASTSSISTTTARSATIAREKQTNDGAARKRML
jgi:putative endonuclease